MAKQKSDPGGRMGRPAIYGPKTVRPGILITEEADAMSRRKAAKHRGGCSRSDAWEAAMRDWKPEALTGGKRER